MHIYSENNENPLIWSLLTILRETEDSFKVHTLASELQSKGLLPTLDLNANKALFKRNFLLMNALYQLQEILLPDQWLQVQAMDIQLFDVLPTNQALQQEQDNALRDYYLDWQYFETSSENIEVMFDQFWRRYTSYVCKTENKVDMKKALQIFELDENASSKEIRYQWQKLALKWHPDRPLGNAQKFTEVCAAWKILR